MRGAEIREAFARVWARPWLVVALALTNIGVSVVMTAPLSAMLAMLLDKRPAAAAMAAGNDGLWLEFLTAHSEVATVALVALAAGVVVYGLLSWVLDGGVLAALAFDDERRARGAGAVLGESGARASRMLTIGLFGVLLRTIPLLLAGIAYAIAHAVISGRTFQPMLLTSAVTLVIAAIVWTAASIAIDYARGLSLDDPHTRSWRLVPRGVGMLFVRRAATLQLLAFTLAAWLAVGAVYWLIAPHLSFLVFLTFLRLLTLVARVMITMTTLTAAARITRP